MTRELEAEAGFYDAAIADEDSAHLAEPLEGPYAGLYDAAVAELERRPPTHVLELGCGAGRFASLIGPPTGRSLSYTGVDFSGGMLDAARAYNGVERDVTWGQADLRKVDPCELVPSTLRPLTVIALEVLEHLAADLRVLARCPLDARLILSVPSFDSTSHVRRFARPADALLRYGEVLELETWQMIPLGGRRFFHLITGRVRP